MKTNLLLGSIAAFLIFTAFYDGPFKLKKSFREHFAYIPNGSVKIDNNQIDTDAFFMSKTEVTNAQYQEFLASLPEEKAKQCAIQPEQWVQKLANGEPMKEHYHTHQAYQNYPVVNVTKEGAEAYCQWLTKKYAAMDIGLPEGYRINFRLPNRAEWINAANGELTGPYSWGGPYLRNAQGHFLANFAIIGPENVHRNPETGEYEIVITKSLSYMGTLGNLNENADVLAPANAYPSNRYGLKNMNGNAAEILADSDLAAGGSWRCPGYDIRNESTMPYDMASPEVGFRVIGVVSAIE